MQEFIREYGKMVATFITYAIVMFAGFGVAFNGMGILEYAGEKAPEVKDSSDTIVDNLIDINAEKVFIDVVNIPQKNTIYYLNAEKAPNTADSLFDTNKIISDNNIEIATIKLIKISNDDGTPVTDDEVEFYNDINTDGTSIFKKSGYYTIVVEATLNTSVSKRTFKIRIF